MFKVPISKRYLGGLLLALVLCLLTGFLLKKRQHSQNPHRWAFYRDLNYGPSHNQDLDLFLPNVGLGPLPLIVFIHGGGWAFGDKRGATFFELSKRGYALASINYRLSGENPFPAQIEDCKGAVSFLRANADKFGLDPNRIGVWGCSSGGQLAMLLATTGDGKIPSWETECNGVSSQVKAVCDWAGPCDLVSLIHTDKLDKDVDMLAKKLVGTQAAGQERRLASASPVNYVERGDPPVLIMHSVGDKVIPISQSEELSVSLKAKGVQCTFIPVEAAIDASKHSFYTVQNEALVGDFFDRILKNRG